ncbi:MAG: formyltransferase family protein, partial [Chitinophagaceae bacterium]
SYGIQEFCTNNSTPFFAGNPNNTDLKSFYSKFKAELLLSINYLFIVSQETLDMAERYAINFHGSLLPKYRGRTPHVWAIINGENETGVTAHLMEGEVDNGAIIKQVRIPISKNDTGAQILKLFHDIYPSMVDEIIGLAKENKINPIGQKSEFATYFGKRTPFDGLINWEWHWERIRNWVRAQAHPYPGAFAFLNNEKIIIHKIEKSEFGFHQDEANGSILHVNSDGTFIVKTANSSVRVVDFEPFSFKLQKGMQFKS